jgi:hypothetical protein
MAGARKRSNCRDHVSKLSGLTVDSQIINSETGGFFELEIARKEPYHSDALALNSARNALVYFLSGKKAKRIFLPDYICNTVIRALQKAGIEHRFYTIGPDFDIVSLPDLACDEYILSVNYFGLMQEKVRQLCAIYTRALIADNAQAFFAKPPNAAATLYSPRKFFGVADGGYLISGLSSNNGLKQDVSWDRYSHLLQRHDCGAKNAYDKFLQNEALIGKLPPRYMSRITQRLLASVDYETVKNRRRANFRFFQSCLSGLNEYEWSMADDDVPLIYPFLCSAEGLWEHLIQNNIFVARYWAEVEERTATESFANKLSRNLVPLPIDQRYDESQLQRVVDAVKQYLKSTCGKSCETNGQN